MHGSETENFGGIFDDDETVEFIGGARAPNSSKVSKLKVRYPMVYILLSDCCSQGAIRLVPASVSAIESKERRGTSITKRAIPSKSQLPLSSFDDHRKWEDEFMPQIFAFTGAQELQYGMSTNPALKFFVKDTWCAVYPQCKDAQTNPALIGVVSRFFSSLRFPSFPCSTVHSFYPLGAWSHPNLSQRNWQACLEDSQSEVARLGQRRPFQSGLLHPRRA